MTVFEQKAPSFSQVSDYKNIVQPEKGDHDYSDYYDNALKGIFGEIERAKPQCGYYRLKREDTAVGIWLFEGEAVIKIGNEMPDYFEPRHEDIWLSASRRPVKKWCWMQAVDTGKWPDIPYIEHGKNESDDPYQSLVERAEGKVEFAAQWLKEHSELKDETEANFARNLSEELRDLRTKEADPMYKAEVSPLDKAVADCRGRYRFRDKLSSYRDELTRIVKKYLDDIEAKRRAAVRAAQAEQARLAEDARKEAEKAAKKGKPIQEPVVPVVPIPEPAKMFVGGGRGRRTSFQETFTAVVGDFHAAFAFLRSFDPKLDEAVTKAANDYVKRFKEMSDIPGCVIKNNLGDIIRDNTIKAEPAKAKSKKVKAS